MAELTGDMVREARAAYAELCAQLDALSPLRVLERGYAIAMHESTGRAIHSKFSGDYA